MEEAEGEIRNLIGLRMRKRNAGKGGDEEDNVVLHGNQSKDTEFQNVGEQRHYSITEDMLPSLGVTARITRHPVSKSHIIFPFNRRYRLWEVFLVYLVFYTAWFVPFEFGFVESHRHYLSILDNVVNAFFFIDITITFFVAYVDKSTYLLITDRKKIASRYLKKGFVFDVISIIPSELVHVIIPHKFQSWSYFAFLRLWRLRRASVYFSRMEKKTSLNYSVIRCFKLLSVTLFTIHLCGCFFYRMASSNKNPGNTWYGSVRPNFLEESLISRYVTSVYWSITTLSTTGYGDLHPVNTREMMFVIVCMMVELVLTAYLIGNMTNLIVHSTINTRKFRDCIHKAKKLAKKNHIPRHLRDQMFAHINLKFRESNEGLDPQETLEFFPRPLRTSIANFLFYTLMENLYLFRSVTRDFLLQLVAEIKVEYFNPREDLMFQNGFPTDLYIVVTGSADIIETRDGVEKIVGEAKEGDIVGEVAMLGGQLQPFTVRTKALSQFLRLNCSVLSTLLQSSLSNAEIIMDNLLGTLQDSKLPGMYQIYRRMKASLRKEVNLPGTLCSAVLAGDGNLLLQLLSEGKEANEADAYGRTALHLACCIGEIRCVLLLIKHGADVNSEDEEGNVPLWEAMVSENKITEKILRQNGALLSSGDTGRYAAIAAEQNNLNLLQLIVEYGGDVKALPRSGTPALWTAVREDNLGIAEFLLENGVDRDVDIPEEEMSEEMRGLLHSVTIRERLPALMRNSSDCPASLETPCSSCSVATEPNYRSRRLSTYRNSLLGMLSAANASATKGESAPRYPLRVTISCNAKGSKVVKLPKTMRELIEIGASKFKIVVAKVVNEEGAEVDDLEIVRDGDHLILVEDDPKSENVKSI